MKNNIKWIKSALFASVISIAIGGTQVQAETLRLLTWGGYAPDNIIALFNEKYPDIKVEVTVSNNEEMIAKLRATGGSGFDLAQPSHDRIYAVQLEYGLYKPLDLSKINMDNLEEGLVKGVKDNTTIDGNVYAVPHQWGTSGLMADVTKAPDFKSWNDLCDPKYKGRTSMRLKRTILLGTAFGLGKDPFVTMQNKEEYQKLLDQVEAKLIECKANIKAYWMGGDDLSAMMLSGEIVASETWDSTAFKLMGENPNIRFVPPSTGALAWIDTFVIPKKGQADDAAYKWINFVTSAEIVPLMSASTGAIAATKGGTSLLPEAMLKSVQASFSDADVANLKFFANIPPGIEDMEGKTLERIKAATGG